MMTYFYISDGTPIKLEHCIITPGHNEWGVAHTVGRVHNLKGAKHRDTFEIVLPPGVENGGDFLIADETGTVFGCRCDNVVADGAKISITGQITGSREPLDRAKAQEQIRGIM